MERAFVLWCGKAHANVRYRWGSYSQSRASVYVDVCHFCCNNHLAETKLVRRCSSKNSDLHESCGCTFAPGWESTQALSVLTGTHTHTKMEICLFTAEKVRPITVHLFVYMISHPKLSQQSSSSSCGISYFLIEVGLAFLQFLKDLNLAWVSFYLQLQATCKKHEPNSHRTPSYFFLLKVETASPFKIKISCNPCL